MCGIAGIFSLADHTPPVDPVALERMREAMVPRGPDALGQWVADDGRAGLAHRRLSIIDLSDGGAQPMHGASGVVTIAYNGEIYNYKELRAELEQGGVSFRSDSDTEVILHLYERDGVDCLQRLRGMYAIALWDADKQGVLLARDPFGIKPLYIAERGGEVRVASQVKALLAGCGSGGGIDTTPDPAGRAGFLLWGSVPEPFTLYKGIQALPAGHALWLDRKGAREEIVHYDLASRLAHSETAPFEPEKLEAALVDSIAHHLIADVPVGVFLSAGLDSATMLALATQAHNGPVTAFTLGFDEFAGTDKDEVPLATAIAKHYGADHKIGRVTAKDFAENKDAILAAMDQPSIDGVNTYFVAREARKAGLKVALSGLGGDELLGGYDTFAQVPRLRALAAPFASLPGLGPLSRVVLTKLLDGRASPKWAGVIDLGGEWGGAYLLRRGLFMPWELPQIMGREEASEGWHTLRMLAWPSGAMGRQRTSRAAVSSLEMRWYMRNQLLRDADWAGMAHSLEIRTPLVDVGLFEALLPMLTGPKPPGKRDMALSPAKRLPEDVLNKPKTGFFVPVSDWMQAGTTAQSRGLRGWAKTVLERF